MTAFSSTAPANRAPEFTLQDFVRSLNDKPQWFDFFHNRAVGIGVNLGFDETEVRQPEKKHFADFDWGF